jgi:hypothetical protein
MGSLGVRMLLAAVAGAVSVAGVCTLVHIGLTAAVVFATAAGVLALAVSIPFAAAVNRLYGDLPLADDSPHCAFWCALSLVWGAIVGGGPVAWFVMWLLEHAG